MSEMVSEITGFSIVYSTVCSGADQRKRQSYASLAFVRGILPVTGELPTQRTSNAEHIAIWWRHHELRYASTCGNQGTDTYRL